MRATVIGAIVIVVVVFITAVFFASGTTIPPGHVGIVVNQYGSNKGVQDYTVSTGRVWYSPIGTTVVEYPTYVQTVKWTANPNEGGLNDGKGEGTENESITFTTGKSVTVNADVALSYQLEYDKIPAFYVKFRSDDLRGFTYGFLHNVTRDAMMEIGGHYDVEDIMGNNEKFLHEVRERIQSQVGPSGVQIQQFGFIGAPRPPQSVTDAINAAQQAKYLAATKQNELAQAQADAAKQVAWAEGEARSVIAKAEGNAKANKLLSESLTPNVLERARLDVQWHLIEKWNGQLPQWTTGGSGPNMLLTQPMRPPQN